MYMDIHEDRQATATQLYDAYRFVYSSVLVILPRAGLRLFQRNNFVCMQNYERKKSCMHPANFTQSGFINRFF